METNLTENTNMSLKKVKVTTEPEVMESPRTYRNLKFEESKSGLHKNQMSPNNRPTGNYSQIMASRRIATTRFKILCSKPASAAGSR